MVGSWPQATYQLPSALQGSRLGWEVAGSPQLGPVISWAFSKCLWRAAKMEPTGLSGVSPRLFATIVECDTLHYTRLVTSQSPSSDQQLYEADTVLFISIYSASSTIPGRVINEQAYLNRTMGLKDANYLVTLRSVTVMKYFLPKCH